MSTRWFEDFHVVKLLGHYLAFEKHFSAKELQAYYDMPWLWQQQWEEYDQLRMRRLEEARLAEDDDGWTDPA